MQNIEIANVYCRSERPENNIVSKYFQITEKSLIKNLFSKRIPSGKEISLKYYNSNISINETNVIKYARKRRLQIYFWIRELIWFIGRWKSKELIRFIDEFKPNIIFSSLYGYRYLNDIEVFVKRHTKKKIVTFVADDIFSYKQFRISPLFWLDRVIRRGYIRKTVKLCEYIYVISEIQKQEYQKCFNKECRVLFKGGRFNGEAKIKKELKKPIKIVYTGNIGEGRWKTLKKIGNALSEINSNCEQAKLYIYTLSPMTNKMKRVFNNEKCIEFMGGISGNQVKIVQEDADILVHSESIALKDSLTVRLSFSNKIVDYFQAARCIYAVGRKDIASINYLIKNDAAVVATNDKEICSKLKYLIENPNEINEYAKKAWECGKNNHQIEKIQNELFRDLNSLCKANE
jgi:hypothetical protein